MRGTALLLAAMIFFTAGSAAAQEEKLGKVRFKTSCTAAAQKEFERALALLHSFAFPETVKAFSAIPQTDPKCAIAWWGVAASLRPDPFVGPWPDALQKQALDAVAQGEAAGAKSAREKDWLAAIKVLYRDFDKVDQDTRSRNYEKAMAALVRKYPEDVEARVFHALALNEIFDGKDTRPITLAIKSLQPLERRYADHPGILHYLIRGFELGPATKKALPYASRYARIAPAAPHAHQMSSHIYSMLGMWKETVAANLAAVRVAAEFTERHKLDGTLADVLRAYDALVYAHLQLGQDASALAALHQAAKVNKVLGPLPAAQAAFAAAAARYALERQDWKAAAKLAVHQGYAVAETVSRFARVLGASRSGDVAAASAEIDKLRAIRAAFDGRQQVYWTEQTETTILASQAWVAQAQGKRREAHKLMRAAADLEDASARNTLLENRLYPMRELLGDLLREQGDPGAALTEYDAVLKTVPNRLRSYYGAAKSAEAIGEKKKAAMFFAQLAKLTQDADGARPELIELKAKTP
jgi:tetratricopeptide (TPR) repeat protein